MSIQSLFDDLNPDDKTLILILTLGAMLLVTLLFGNCVYEAAKTKRVMSLVKDGVDPMVATCIIKGQHCDEISR